MQTNNKLREAAKETQAVIAKCMDILNRIPDSCGYGGLIDDVADELCDLREQYVKPALAEPVRNCDVGTPEEQDERYRKFCSSYKEHHGNCIGCPAMRMSGSCESGWAQMPYAEKEGGAK